MSRRYCYVCHAPHNNPNEGLCDVHLAENEAHKAEQARLDALAEEHADAAFTCFMQQSEDMRWREIWDATLKPQTGRGC